MLSERKHSLTAWTNCIEISQYQFYEHFFVCFEVVTFKQTDRQIWYCKVCSVWSISLCKQQKQCKCSLIYGDKSKWGTCLVLQVPIWLSYCHYRQCMKSVCCRRAVDCVQFELHNSVALYKLYTKATHIGYSSHANPDLDPQLKFAPVSVIPSSSPLTTCSLLRVT